MIFNLSFAVPEVAPPPDIETGSASRTITITEDSDVLNQVIEVVLLKSADIDANGDVTWLKQYESVSDIGCANAKTVTEAQLLQYAKTRAAKGAQGTGYWEEESVFAGQATLGSKVTSATTTIGITPGVFFVFANVYGNGNTPTIGGCVYLPTLDTSTNTWNYNPTCTLHKLT